MKITAGQHIHLVGIGGAGMSAIARILLGQKYVVSGSDRSLNSLTDALARDGATIYAGHAADNIAGAEALIISSAIPPDQVEVQAAQSAGIPVYKRADILADLMVGKQVIAIAGTAGKTTTTAMITHILLENRRDPSYIIGGVLSTSGQNAGVGGGGVFVVEADEYDHMFLGLRPNIAVITNIQWDHPDFFKTPEAMRRSFEQFVDLLPEDGIIVACGDDPLAREVAENWKRQQPRGGLFLYGIEQTTGFVRAANIEPGADDTKFTYELLEIDFQALFIHVNVPGQHNVLNALAAITVVNANPNYANYIPLVSAAEALATFNGTARRFELKGEAEGIAVIDDYAHHPAKIRATLQAARSRYPDRQIWAVWQPHTYSRTQALHDDFVAAFADADQVLVTDIYAAREQPIPGVSAAEIAAQIPRARFTPTFDETVAVLAAEVKPLAAVIIMSAGDAPQVGVEFLKRISAKAQQ